MEAATQDRTGRDRMSWSRASFKSIDEFSLRLSAGEAAELAGSARALDRQGRLASIETLVQADFKLSDALGARLRGAYDEVREGKGFVLLRGLPVEGLSVAQFTAVNWAVGSYFGQPLSQNARGERIGHVVDASREEATPRYYRTSLEARMHNDITAMITLACWNPSKSGGASLIASAVRVHDEIQARAPHLLEPLYRGFHHHRLGEEGEGEEAVTPYRMPVFAVRNGKLSCRYQRTAIVAGQKALGMPLTPLEIEALDLFDRTAQARENRLAFYLERGDMMVLNNYTMMHARTAFADFEEPEKRRHLVRLWLDAPGFRDVPRALYLFSKNGVPAQPGRQCTFDFKQLFGSEKAAGGLPDLQLDEAELL